MQIVDSHSQSIAKLETQLGQLTIGVSKREEGKTYELLHREF